MKGASGNSGSAGVTWPEAGKGSLLRTEDGSGLQWREGRLDWQPDRTCLLTDIVTAFGL